ncbi:uncharacterized protein E0L32_008588 [Thyridium curvatum]|uniref:Vps72/YL1 C-terminal domain-containing protein n=1 Tax=Thyridium curvatum TaxID=1093900 RepID=A0A507B0P3_9PEZI|nr:uncharacterized protein E0L32_008588 [Thyridium curvatum]TPX10538.1 hypothetical protein E0L32_008588 [Thyridium curvatum]
MSNPEAQAAQAAHQALIEQLDIHSIHKTFRNPHWRPNQRRNKNVKTIIGDASKREANSTSVAPTPLPDENGGGASGAATPAADKDDDGLSTSGTSTPAGPSSAAGAASVQPNLAQASRSLSKLVLEKSLRSSTNGGGGGGGGAGGGAGSSSAASVSAAAMGGAPPVATYTNIESAPSLAPQKRYCDITGMPAPYTDPKTRLRYYNSEVFTAIRGFQQGVAEQFLEARGAHTVLK